MSQVKIVQPSPTQAFDSHVTPQSSTPDISVIILNWNTRDMLADCLETLLAQAGHLTLELIVVDNASTDGSQAMLRQRFPQVHLIANRDNVGFARGNNQGMGISRGRYLLLLNSDAFISPGSLEALLQLADTQPLAGIVGAHLLNADGTFQASHTPFPNLWQEFMILTGLGRLLFGRWYPSRGPEEAKGPQIVDYVEGACLLVRPAAFRETNGLDEGFFMYAEEVDWCYTMRQKGWQVWYQPAAKIVHLGGGSSQGRRTQREGDLYRSRVRFFRKHYGNLPAQLLKLQIYGLTVLKIAVHGLLRLISGGRRGRPVVSLKHLLVELKEV
ncbi:MAG: glycosyltransferase family 2 protein [Anaerolineae bacterium]|nr:glycosyltransferase family 2 protein [Anaerolineae bacterium]